jgi:hypothetical protein
MNKFCIGSAAIMMIALSGCEETGKDNVVTVANKPVDSQVVAVTDVPELKVLKWGPLGTTAGVVVNKQPSGETAFWFQLVGKAKAGTKLELWFGDTRLVDVIVNTELTTSAILPTPLLDKVGDYPVYFIYAPTKKRIDVGIFKIAPVPVATPMLNTDTAPALKTKKLANHKETQAQ